VLNSAACIDVLLTGFPLYCPASRPGFFFGRFAPGASVREYPVLPTGGSSMTTFRGIPVVESGTKYRTHSGVAAVKNGVKKQTRREDHCMPERKPSWLKTTLPGGQAYADVLENVRRHRLSTVCEESMCPNIGECWANGTATIMLMGDVCTRACRFCAVDTGNPGGRLDPDEPHHAAQSVRLMGLRYVVLTSVDRDDLPDGGAAHFAACVAAIRQLNPDTVVEVLTPDFAGSGSSIRTLLSARPDVYAHNVETVERLSAQVRDPRAGYRQSLDLLDYVKKQRPDMLTKSSLMLGLGETEDEIRQVMRDLRCRGVDILTLGQYLRPTRNHLPVRHYIDPEQFRALRYQGLQQGFREVVSGPFVRSSYRAERVLEGSNVGLEQNR